jgi:nitrite reductase/ring-hydroxylating ferredoxin subunit
MSSHDLNWIKIADTLDAIPFNAEGLAECEVLGKGLCLARQGETLRVCAQKCPHAGGHLCDGYLDALGNIVCPIHRYKFNLENGRNVSGEGYFLKTYPVEKRPDGIYVGIEPRKWSLWML